MLDIKACRCCLSVNGKLLKIEDATKRLYSAITGLQIQPSDGFPTYICAECSTQIKKVMAFRRRCRRAFFVLKEIMSVQKQVRLIDVVKVDRVRTNLESPFGYWNAQRSGFYSATTPDAHEDEPIDLDNDVAVLEALQNRAIREAMEESKLKPIVEIEKYVPKVMNKSCIVVDIKPPNCEDEPPNLDDYDFGESNNRDEEPGEDENKEDIDLNDVFKGLEVKEESEPEVEIKEEVIVPKIKKAQKINNMKVGLICTAFVSATVRYLPIPEQVTAYQARLNREPFRSATFKCAVCVDTFQDLPELMSHVENHNKQVTKFEHLCNICKARFYTADKLKRHSAKVHWYEYTCNECGKRNYTLAEMRTCRENHINVKCVKIKYLKKYFHVRALQPWEMRNEENIKKLSKFVCDGCHSPFKNNTEVANHKRKCKSRIKFLCEICDLNLRNRYIIDRHMESWHLYSYTCKKRWCKAVMHNKADALRHKNDHVAGALCHRYECTFCKKTFNTGWKHKQHMATHHLEEARQLHVCNVCGISAISQYLLYKHQILDHRYISINDPNIGMPEFRCEQCGVQFVSENALYVHQLLRHHLPLAQQLECAGCKTVFDMKEDLNAHQTTCQLMKKCCYCAESFPAVKIYAAHLREQHREGSIYLLCELCGDTVLKSMVAHHARHAHKPKTNTVTGKFDCSYCSTTLPTARLHVSHILYNHTQKPYLCNRCPARFRQRFECRDHIMKVHAPGLYYKCPYCERQFSHSKFLNQHCLVAHCVKRAARVKNQIFWKDIQGKLCVYPDMKIDGSLLDTNLLEKVEVVLWDYAETESSVVDFRDYFVFDCGMEPILPSDKIVKKPKEETKKPKEETKKRTRTSDGKKGRKRKKTIEDNVVVKTEEIDNVEYLEYESDVAQNEIIESVEQDCENYEVIEKDGEQFVLIDDVLYKIEPTET